jgi:TRAP-type uncharacterized transport system substrate-binding protein
MGSDGQKFFAAFVRTVADAYPCVRLKLVPMASRGANAKALTAGEADLAVVRSDMLTSSGVQPIAILQCDVVGLVIPPHAPIAKVRDLAGKTIGLVQGTAGDAHILDQILAYYQSPADTLQRVVLTSGEIGPAIRQKRGAALFALGPAGPVPLPTWGPPLLKPARGPSPS